MSPRRARGDCKRAGRGLLLKSPVQRCSAVREKALESANCARVESCCVGGGDEEGARGVVGGPTIQPTPRDRGRSCGDTEHGDRRSRDRLASPRSTSSPYPPDSARLGSHAPWNGREQAKSRPGPSTQTPGVAPRYQPSLSLIGVLLLSSATSPSRDAVCRCASLSAPFWRHPSQPRRASRPPAAASR